MPVLAVFLHSILEVSHGQILVIVLIKQAIKAKIGAILIASSIQFIRSYSKQLFTIRTAIKYHLSFVTELEAL